jgi:hypothetical protein
LRRCSKSPIDVKGEIEVILDRVCRGKKGHQNFFGKQLKVRIA